MAAQHTPTPWQSVFERLPGETLSTHTLRGTGGVVGKFIGAFSAHNFPKDADHDFILLACNAHEEFVGLLGEAMGLIRTTYGPENPLVTKIKNALAKTGNQQ